MSRNADIMVLLAAGRTPHQVATALNCKLSAIYNARWASRHGPRAPYVRPRPRHDLAVELLTTMTQEEAAAKMGVSVRTIQNYSAGSRGTGRRPGAPNDVNVERPRCACSLSLFTSDELATGRCNDCLHNNFAANMGRTSEPIAHSTGDHFA